MINLIKKMRMLTPEGWAFLSCVIMLVLCLNFVAGCGTSVATNIKTTGLDGTIPIYGIPVGVRIGNAEVDTQALRGNSTYVTQTATGGGLWSGSAGTGKTTIFSTNPQFNEGYVKDVFVDPNVPEAVKLALAEKYLAQTKAPEVQPSSLKTLSAGAAAGNNPPQAEPATTGTDKILEEIGKAVPIVAEPVKDVANNAIDKTGAVIPSVMDSVESIIGRLGWVVIIVVIVVLLLVIILGYAYYKYKKQKDIVV